MMQFRSLLRRTICQLFRTLSSRLPKNWCVVFHTWVLPLKPWECTVIDSLYGEYLFNILASYFESHVLFKIRILLLFELICYCLNLWGWREYFTVRTHSVKRGWLWVRVCVVNNRSWKVRRIGKRIGKAEEREGSDVGSSRRQMVIGGRR